MGRGRIIPLLIVEFNIPGWPISWWGYLLANIGEKCTCIEKSCRNLKNDVINYQSPMNPLGSAVPAYSRRAIIPLCHT